MNITMLDSNDQILAELGRRFRSWRIDSSLTQGELARRSGVSLSTIAGIERGSDARMGSYLSVLRALGMLENANALISEAEERPSELARLSHRRQRVRLQRCGRPSRDVRGERAGGSTWKWGDER